MPDGCNFAYLGDGFFRMIVESLSHEIFVCDADGTVIYLNPASEYLTGRKKENVVGRNIRELRQDGTISHSVTLQVMETQRICTLIQKVASGKDLLIVGIPIFNEENKMTHILSSAQDIAEVNQLNNELMRKNEELQRKMHSLEIMKNEYLSAEDLLLSGAAMESVVHTVLKAAPLDVSILILGETGVGKEGIAKMTHRLSQRKKEPFVKINCGMIPEHLFESELFGYEEGSFTGAVKGGKIGKVEMAHKGTLFLDEIGELPLPMQVKLLEFLQDRTITRVGGGHKKIPVDTRIVAATHRDLKAMCDHGEFRQDLYYRLNVLPIRIPPLREWRDEIIHLAQFFLARYNRKYHTAKYFSKDVLPILTNYEWPGNIRELEHIIERLFITAEGSELTSAELRQILGVAPGGDGEVFCQSIMPLKQAKQQLEAQLLERAYRQYGSSYKVAKVLNCDQSTVVKLRKKYQIPLPNEQKN
ncbi:MAG: sigma 54-interacting transcriptional regulator [Bacillota bacterium]|nr:sigma 54-interacting transcriptional regulator [Bacillota bacterium]